MKPKTIYLVLCFAGVVLPYWQFVPWVMQHGMNLSLFSLRTVREPDRRLFRN
jgi:Terpene cyclase DEP1